MEWEVYYENALEFCNKRECINRLLLYQDPCIDIYLSTNVELLLQIFKKSVDVHNIGENPC